uniref:Uncharacterized protein n=1 Tax=viral metagenome TaxID=1070528 RepID=A0A6C0KIU9_9ZZZZ
MSSYIARTRKLQKHASDQGEVLKISGGGGSVIAMKRNACNNRCVSSGGLFNTGPRFVSPSSILEKKKNFRTQVAKTTPSQDASFVINDNKIKNLIQDNVLRENVTSSGGICANGKICNVFQNDFLAMTASEYLNHLKCISTSC